MKNAKGWCWAITAAMTLLVASCGQGKSPGKIAKAEKIEREHRAEGGVRKELPGGSVANARSQPLAHALTQSAAASAFHFDIPSQYQELISLGEGSSYYEPFVKVLIADVTGDGKDDLIALPTDNQILVFVQAQNGTLGEPQIWNYRSNNTTHGKEAVLADFNHDGVKDVAFMSNALQEWPWTISMLLSDGRGHLGLVHTDIDVGTDGQYWTTMDVDLDGNPDIIQLEGTRLRIMYGNGTGRFGRTEFRNMPSVQQEFQFNLGEAVDLDGDGFKDLLLGRFPTFTEPGKLFAMYNNKYDGFGTPVELRSTVPVGPGTIPGVQAADFNGDRLSDLMSGMDVSMTKFDGTYAAPNAVPSWMQRSDWPLIADMDGDGWQDVISVQMVPLNGGFTVQLAWNRQVRGVFELPVLADHYFPLDKIAQNEKAMAVGDLDSDGCKDVVIAAEYEGLLRFNGLDCIKRKIIKPDESGSIKPL